MEDIFQTRLLWYCATLYVHVHLCRKGNYVRKFVASKNLFQMNPSNLPSFAITTIVMLGMASASPLLLNNSFKSYSTVRSQRRYGERANAYDFHTGWGDGGRVQW